DAFDFRKSCTGKRTRDRLTVGLPPPAFCRSIFKHGVEVIHAHQPEHFRFAFGNGFKYPPGAAHVAVRYHYRLPTHAVTYLMMVQYDPDRVRLRLTLVFHSNYQGAVA